MITVRKVGDPYPGPLDLWIYSEGEGVVKYTVYREKYKFELSSRIVRVTECVKQ
jgi:hypothetical protein